MELQDNDLARPSRHRQRRTSMERCLIGMTVFLLFSSLALVVSLVYVVAASSSQTSDASSSASASTAANGSHGAEESGSTMALHTVPERVQEICVTPGCIDVAYQLLQFRNVSVDPCDNFFEHACGGWDYRVKMMRGYTESGFTRNLQPMDYHVEQKILRSLNDPKYRSVDGFRRAQDFFKFCSRALPAEFNVLELAADKILLEELGGFKTTAEWQRSPVDLTSTFLQLSSLLGEQLFAFTVQIDPYNNSKISFDVTVPASGDAEAAKRRRHLPRSTVLERVSTLQHVVRENRKRLRRRAVETVVDNEVEEDEEDVAKMSFVAKFLALLKAQEDSQYKNKLVTFVKDFKKRNNSSVEISDEDYADMVEFVSNQNELLPTIQEKGRISRMEHRRSQFRMSMEELQSNYTFVNWTRLFSESLGLPVSGTEAVYVRFPAYLHDLEILLEMYPPRIVHNAILLKYRVDTLGYFVTAWSSLVAETALVPTYCSDITKELFPVAVAGLYVRQAGRQRVEKLRRQVDTIFSSLRKELVHSIRKRAKQHRDPFLRLAERKVRKVRTLLIAPDYLWNDSYINSNTPTHPLLTKLLQQDIGGESGDDYDYGYDDSPEPVDERSQLFLDILKLTFSVIKSTVHRQLRLRNSPKLLWDYNTQAYTPNAFHMSEYNTMVVPLAFLTEPYFYEDVPNYVTYATLGFTLAHELLHGIDSTGIFYDEHGRIRRMSAAVEQSLTEIFRCVRENYVKSLEKTIHLETLPITIQLNGNLTLDENIADLGGLALGWRTYRRWRRQHGPEKRLPGVHLTHEQVMLLVEAQIYCDHALPAEYLASAATESHAPNVARVTGMMKNWPPFAEAFSCPPGSPMNPRNKCDIPYHW